MLEGSSTKSAVLVKAFIAWSSAGGGMTSLRSSRCSHPARARYSRTELPINSNDFMAQHKSAPVRRMAPERISHCDLLLKLYLLEILDFILSSRPGESSPDSTGRAEDDDLDCSNLFYFPKTNCNSPAMS